MGYEGNDLTWSNNQSGRRRIWQRLDRVLINGEVHLNMPDFKLLHLPRVSSDHSPIL